MFYRPRNEPGEIYMHQEWGKTDSGNKTDTAILISATDHRCIAFGDEATQQFIQIYVYHIALSLICFFLFFDRPTLSIK